MGKPNDLQRGRVGAWLKHAMDAKGWTAAVLQRELAREGYVVKVGTVQQWMGGYTQPAAKYLPLVAALLGVPEPLEPDPEIARLADGLLVQARAINRLASSVASLARVLAASAEEAVAEGVGDALRAAEADLDTAGSLGALPHAPSHGTAPR